MRIAFEFNEEAMRRLYAELTAVFRELDVDFAKNRGKMTIPSLYQMYDELYKAGIA